MRTEFHAIVEGWTLHSGLDDLTERIECAAEWTKANGPLEPDEEATIKLMIEAQIARGMDPEEYDGQPDQCAECDQAAVGYDDGTPVCASHYRGRGIQRSK